MNIDKIKQILFNYRIVFIVALLFPLLNYNISVVNDWKKKEVKFRLFKRVADSLIKYGVDSYSVFSLVNDKRTHYNERFARINISPQVNLDFSEVYSQQTIKIIQKFIENNFEILIKAETTFGVPKEIISIILWVETKFGKVLGKNHIPSVLFSMATSTETSILAQSVDTINNRNWKTDTLYEVTLQRAKKKEEFAIKELLALFEIQKKGFFEIRDLYGSYSGAFGLPQFLPSSYLQYGFDGNKDGKIDLFNLEDAIFSIGNFLKKNGFIPNDTNSYYTSLFKYNRSRQYVQAILWAYNELIRKKAK
ncbi:MAG: lytic murein transglycosylase [Ignavibacteria bacterium]|nr:lytic murein transglycosylase [Ignavibacteria bacterium]